MTTSGAIDADDGWGTRTRWTRVQSAADLANQDSVQAWRELLERYREPVRSAFMRRLRGHPEADQAADDFFTYLFERGVLSKIDREQGRFRCYLQGVIRLYAHAWLRAQRPHAEPIDDDRLSLGVSDEHALELEEERQWASSLLERALERLERAHTRDARLLVYAFGLRRERVRPSLELQNEFGLTTTALHVALHRARGRLREQIVDEVRETVATENDVEEEVKLLLARLPPVCS